MNQAAKKNSTLQSGLTPTGALEQLEMLRQVNSFLARVCGVVYDAAKETEPESTGIARESSEEQRGNEHDHGS